MASSIKRVALIGPGADDKRLLQGDYHYPSHLELIYAAPQNFEAAGLEVPQAGGRYVPGPYYTPHITPRMGLRAALGGEVEISYVKGCEVLGEDRSGFAEAVSVATEADVVIAVVAGKSGLLRPVTVGEANDATNLDLTGVQPELINALAGAGKPLVVTVLSGRIHTLAVVAEKADALLQMFPAGEEGGNGLADVLTGRVNPAARLPVTMPRSVGQIPRYAGHRAGGERAMFFDGYIDSPVSPLFPFGHGLSYSSFSYSKLIIQMKSITESIVVSLEVQNTGERAGDEVVQLYCHDLVASVARPIQILLGFTRLTLAAGQACSVTFSVHPSRLAFYNPQMRFVTEPGAFTFSVGASSADIRVQETVMLDGELVEYRQREVVDTIVTSECL